MSSSGVETEHPDAIGSYAILRELGRGGMGVVYLATDPRLDRQLALKVLSKRIAREPERVRRFEQEARILAAVDHPNIATIYSLEESDGLHFLTMEYVSGETLADQISRSPLPADDALRLAEQIASALEAAHRQGVVHRDLKPANVMVTPALQAKVLDFGLAKTRPRDERPRGDDDTASDSFGPILGTPGYASPEQLRDLDVDHRADVWAFGCVLWESLIGSPAFPGDSPADRIAATLQQVPDPVAAAPGLPKRLHRLLRRCLERDPKRRLGSIGRARREISEIRADRPRSEPSTPLDAEVMTTSHNLPLQLASFVGRERERREIAAALREHRLVTLTGAGGSGKTRLALEIAYELLGEFLDGVWLANLASVSDPAQVTCTVACALGAQEEPHRALVDTLADHVAGKRLLLVLDNCEHLLAACAQLSEVLLARDTSFRILATSHEALGLTGEFVYRVSPLPVPEPSETAAVEKLGRVASVQLFVERAAAAGGGFVMNEENAAAVSGICRRLDGIPLAIELAAARIRALPPDEIERRLQDRFHLLSASPVTVEPRHRTLRALIDWSYGLLSDPEQTLFRRLAVFAGGWDLDAAEAICAGDGIEVRDVLGLLSHLVERSLVEVRAAGNGAAGPRYRMLRTVRAYAQDVLRNSGVYDEVRRRHREYFADLAKRASRGLTGPEQATWVERLDRDHDELRAAIEACAAADVVRGLELVGDLGRYWYVRGRWSEGRELLADFLAQPESSERTAERARALSWAGWLAYWQGAFERATAVLDESLSISRELGNALAVAEALNNLGAVAKDLGELERSRDCHQEALAIRRQKGDRRAVAVSVHNLGEVYLSQGEYEKARAAYEESHSLFREVGHLMGVADSLSSLGQIAERTGDLERARAFHEESLENRRGRNDPMGTSESLRNLGRLAAQQSDHERAHALFAEGLSISLDLGDRVATADGLEALGELAAARGAASRAARILGAAAAHRERIHAPSSADARERLEEAVGLAREALGPDGFQTEWNVGQEMPLESAVEIALAGDD